MKTYKNFDTGIEWTEEEIRDEYNKLYELHEEFPTFDAYIEHLIDQGLQGIGGIVEVRNWYAVQQDSTDAWDNGSYDMAEAIAMANEQDADLIAVIDDSGDDAFCVSEMHRGEDF